MAMRAKKICKKIGCNNLVEGGGFCIDHKKDNNNFKLYDENKDPIKRKFYSSSRWTKASIRQRRREPLCKHCLENGITKEAEMVHHNPSLDILLNKGLSPIDPKYLHSLCDECHREEHRGENS